MYKLSKYFVFQKEGISNGIIGTIIKKHNRKLEKYIFGIKRSHKISSMIFLFTVVSFVYETT